ncbi:MAG TPA: flagellar hook-basal body complex protein FliE [Burkholderiales bacterium]|nr:flagellar hook-basal body complex protein FliE [Burkholderiales bacterium]
MNVYAIDPALLPSAQDAQSLPASAPARTFPVWLDEQIRTANQGIIEADDAVRRLAVGEPVNLHQVMVQLERAKLQFELVLQVRNKLLEAYQDLLRMQI